MLSGRTENNRIVNFPGDEAFIGQVVDVIITEKCQNSLRVDFLFRIAHY